MNFPYSLRLLILLLASSVSAIACAGQPTLQKLWETPGFSNPESVVYDQKNNVLYISNVNGNAGDKDSNGFISRVSLDGQILKLDWVTGMNAPKGLAIHGDKLYTADIDTLVEIDIPTATITNRYQVSDAQFLNDVAAGVNGDVYVSDMALNRIHILKDGAFSLWLETPDLQAPNGLLVDGNTLYVGAWGIMTDGFATQVPGHMKSISIADKTITSIGPGTPIGNLDGVETDSKGVFYVTDWMAGKLLRISKTGEVEELLVLEQGMADHEYLQDQNIILLPMMMGNTLLAYKIQ